MNNFSLFCYVPPPPRSATDFRPGADFAVYAPDCFFSGGDGDGLRLALGLWAPVVFLPGLAVLTLVDLSWVEDQEGFLHRLPYKLRRKSTADRGDDFSAAGKPCICLHGTLL